MQNRHNRIIIWILAVLSPLLCAVTYPFLPEQIPVHWDVNGTVSYSGKETFLLMAALPLLLAALFIFLPKIDPRKQSYKKFGKYYDYFSKREMYLYAVVLLMSQTRANSLTFNCPFLYAG